ncbi:MAG TPA: choice-of-anchor tandem repeat GloVer-containing protein [Chitinophagaceae bacterium]|nr:choice-of-anchor tandem repeat GloVer-containing protein [Chitinophagaceae bacterium]
MKKSLFVFLILGLIQKGLSQEFFSDGIVRYNAQTNTIAKEIDLRLIMGNLVQADDGLFYGLEHSDSSNQMKIFSYDHLTKEKITWKIIDSVNIFYENLGLIKGNDGLLYGYTSGGGKYNQGILFSFDPLTQAYYKRFDFGPSAPASLLFTHFTQGMDDLFYGFGGGGGKYGSLISINLRTQEYKILHDFTADEGSNAVGRLLLAKDGLFYGMLGFGPEYKFGGSLFSFDPISNEFKVRFRFEGLNGAWPYGSLIQAKNGRLYGTTSAGWYSGTVFSYDPVAGVQKIIENFQDSENGYTPYGTLSEASDGLLYGVASMGKVIFSVDPVTDIYTKRIVLDTIQASYLPGNQLIEIKPILRPTSLTYVGKTSVQYSDKIMLSALLKNSKNNQPLKGMEVTFHIGERSLNAITNAEGIAQAEIKIGLAPGVTSLSTVFKGNENYQASSDIDEITILPEDARVNYTGVFNASTFDMRSTKARITMSATVRDISAVPNDPSFDQSKGDIGKAVLSFIDLGSNTVIGTAPVQWITNGDSTIGTGIYLWDVDLGGSASRIYSVGVKISGYYQYSSSLPSIKVSKATGISMHGGGTINGAEGKYQFNLNLSQTQQGIKSNTGLKIKGSVNDLYDVSQLSFYSFDAPNCSDAIMNATGRVINGTDRGGVNTNENAILQWEVTGVEKGSTEQIRITAWSSKGRLIFSTNWSGTETNWSGINGNISIDGCGNKLAAKQEQNQRAVEEFSAMKVYPNPSSTSFNIQVPYAFESNVRIKVTDISGRVVEELNVKPGSLIQIGSRYQPGMYFAEMNSRGQRKVYRLLKARS